MQSFKVILAGDHQSGKTSFMLKWNDPNHDHNVQPTIGTELKCHTVEVNGVKYKVQLWDTAGQEAYHSITAPYFRSCKGVFLVFDITNRQSFESLDYWLKMIDENTSEKPVIVIIANKIDLPNRQVEDEEIAKFAENGNYPFFTTSALTGENIENAANCMIYEIIKNLRIGVEYTYNINSQNQRSGCC